MYNQSGGYGGSGGAAVVDIAGQTAGALAQYYGTKETNKTNIRLQKEAQEYDYQKWQEMNAYNAPSQQMQRLIAAGLNPNLVYGTGNVTGNVTGGQAKARTATVVNELANLNVPSVMGVLNAYQDYRIKGEQADSIRAGTELTEVKKANELLRTPLLGLKGESERFKLDLSKILAPYQKTTAEENVFKLQQENQKLLPQRIKSATQETELKQLELDLQKELKPLGVSMSDELWQRILAKFFNKAKETDLNFDKPKFKNNYNNSYNQPKF